MNSFKMLILSVCMLCLLCASALGETLGPATDYAQLLALAAQATDGDVILLSGEIVADAQTPLNTQAAITLRSSEDAPATLRGLRLNDAQISATDIRFEDSLTIRGTSHVELGSGVSVTGAAGQTGLSFDGNGSLILYPDCVVTGGEGGEGVTINHQGGDFYAGIEGTVTGGCGQSGGSGLTISRLCDAGALMISGSISGGSGSTYGGHALNLYDLSGSAFVTVTGTLTGGEGHIGGDGIQLVSTTGNANVGIYGTVTGGNGQSYGGDALILMNMGGASSASLSGSLTGGNVTESGAQPGSSLLVVGSGTASRTHVGDCHLKDGMDLSILDATPTPLPTEEPDITPLPEITSSVEDFEALATPAPTPAPEQTPDQDSLPTEAPAEETTPEPTIEPSIEPTAFPAPDSSPAPSSGAEIMPVPETTLEP